MSKEDGGGTAQPTVHFVRDDAATEDFFGSHGRTAQAIAEIIESAQRHNVIGLLGAWGSGKSTVVNLIQAKLKTSSTPTLIFNYDAWLHQSDPPRRAFLEQFLSFLQSHAMATDKKWTDEMDRLNRRVEETETETTPALTIAGYLIFISLLLVPFGSSLVTETWLGRMRSEHWQELSSWGFPLGVLLTGAPFWIALFFYYLWRPNRCFFSRAFFTFENWKKHRPPYENESLLAVVSNKHVAREKTRVTRTPDPTTLEFQRSFRRMLVAASQEGHRLVIVVDNLDRLPAEAAIVMWTTIRSFFLGAIPQSEPLEVGPPPAVTLPNIILPIDEGALSHIFAEQVGSGGKSATESFIDKTFDVTFHVSQPVLSDCNLYVAEKMRLVFGEEMSREWAVDVARICSKVGGGRSTPRDLNRMINSASALWLQLKGMNIPFGSIAYYAIARKAFESDFNRAMHSPAVDLSEHDANWQQSLAAIHFGVTPDKGLQVFLEPMLRGAIANLDYAAFSDQAKINGFESVLYSQIGAPDYISDPLFNICRLLDRANIGDQVWSVIAWRKLRHAFLKLDLVKSEATGTGEIFAILMMQTPERDQDAFLRNVGGQLNVGDATAAQTERSASNYRALLTEWVEHASKRPAGSMAVQIDDPHVYLEVADIAMADGRPHALFQTKAEGDGLANIFVNQMAAGQPGPRALEKAMLVIHAAPGLETLTTLAEAMKVILTNNAADYVGTEAAVHILGELQRSHDFARNLLDQLQHTGVLQQRTTEALASEPTRLSIRLVAMSFLTSTPMASPGNISWPDLLLQNPDFAQSVSDDIKAYGAKAFLHLIVAGVSLSEAARPLASAIIQRETAQKGFGNLKVQSAVQNMEVYLDLIPEEVRSDFVAEVADYETFWACLQKEEFSGSAVEIFRRLIGPGHNETVRRARARSTLRKWLKDVSVPRWEYEVRAGGSLLELATSLRDLDNRALALQHPTFATLQNLFGELALATDPEFRRRWFTLAGHLSAEGRRSLMRGLRDYLGDANEIRDILGLMREGGDFLIAEGKLEDRADIVINKVIFPLVTRADSLNWLLSRSDALGPVVAKASRLGRSELSSQLTEHIAEGDEMVRALQGQLARAWKL